MMLGYDVDVNGTRKEKNQANSFLTLKKNLGVRDKYKSNY